jgi:oxygen-independent coproporphyrinogen-3 oxidase
MGGASLDLAIYFHWPFCLSKCPYCDFNVHVGAQVDHAQWRAAYLRAIAHYAELYPNRNIVSVYFGGGTPSLMEPATVQAILEAIDAGWGLPDTAEITLEANPTSVEIDKFRDFRAAGVNRVSLGVQALNDADLQFLGRGHDVAGAKRAIALAQSVFDRMSFDLIYARPEQTLAAWEAELREAAKLAAGHLSLYQLTIERNTPFYISHARGDFIMPEQDLAADFYNVTQEVLSAEGLPAYEVSNHAAAGHESRHNLVYWHYGDYLGIGPGAHGRMTGGNGQKMAMRDHHAPAKWMEWVAERGHGVHEPEILSARDQAVEAFMMGIRLYDGIPLTAAWDEFINLKKLESLAGEGWLCYENDHIRLTQEGMLRLNAVVRYVIRDENGSETV